MSRRSFPRKITIAIPPIAEVFRDACSVSTAEQKGQWSSNCLGAYAKRRGVYVMHQHGVVLYVGKTGGDSMDFATRLYRHFNKSAAGGKGNYLRLAQLSQPISVSFITEEQIRSLIKGASMNEHRLEDEVIRLFEAALILEYAPKFPSGARL